MKRYEMTHVAHYWPMTRPMIVREGTHFTKQELTRYDDHTTLCSKVRNRSGNNLLYLLFIIKTACKEFEERLGRVGTARGEKTELVLRATDRFPGGFRVADIQRQCSGVSVDMIRRVLKNLRVKKQVECLGRGQTAQWRKAKKWELGST